MSKLTTTQKITLRRKLNDKWKYRYLYGDIDETSGIKPCIKVKDGGLSVANPFWKYYDDTIDKYRQFYGSNLFCYQISYMLYKGRRPTRQIGHICGNIYNTKNTTCIEPSHISTRGETQKRNNERRHCHDKISYWEIKTRLNRGYTIKGPLYLSYINEKETEKLQNGQTLTKRIDKYDNIDLSDDEDEPMSQDAVNERKKEMIDEYYKCPHDVNNCFINCWKIGWRYIKESDNVQNCSYMV